MGTDAWRNWKAFKDRQPETENADDELHSDRHFVGGPSVHGPYSISVVTGLERTEAALAMRPAGMLHVGIHTGLIPEVVVDGQLVTPNSDAYHGGNASDEIAALASLVLGVRLRVAGTSRISGIHGPDQDESPIHLEVPRLAHPGRVGREYIPMTQRRPADLDQLGRLDSFPALDETTHVELVRAARSYADGLWWSNEDQNQAWLHLVTAVEIAANHRQQSSAPPHELVESLWPELWSALLPAEPDVREAVARLVAPQMRATRKFVDFMTECAPDPPDVRPAWGELEWSEMAAHARLIYRYRSGALHSGKPFPLPMMEPAREEQNGAIQEVPWGLNSGGLGGVWDAAESPMLLSTFEHIARGSLLSWWDELVNVV